MAEQLALYEADKLDLVMVWGTPDADRALQRHAGEYLSGPALYTQYIGLNVRQPPFDDRRLRRALAMAIDKDRLANVTLGGHYFPATGGMVPPEMPGHSPGIGLPYDPAQARQLLAESGYPEGHGFPQVVGLVNQINKKRGAEEVRKQWRQTLGIDVTWQGFEWADLLRRLERELPALLLMGWGADFPDPDNALRTSTHSKWVGWHNETYVRLLEEAKHVADHEARMRIYQQADRILVEDAAIVPIVYTWDQFLLKPWVRKLSPSSMTWTLWKDVIIESH
jgi:ABC-type transport system substrate-binding protein